ncbi:uncharacterized protein LOC111054362 [Nilaparvata lugens]|uniref:uncharacterized protein LOC111054362 n=1 Tax=Nilaparvata lugens TaxID=108931 RepID=UPI00193E8B94|nr:uncharacterized protein LOC111054362 [Nilaparvata lugens]
MDKEMATIDVEQEVNSSHQEPAPECSTVHSPTNDDDDDDDGRQHLGNFCQIIIKEEYGPVPGRKSIVSWVNTFRENSHSVAHVGISSAVKKGSAEKTGAGGH